MNNNTFLKRFRVNRMAVAGAFFVILIAAVAVAAPILSPYGPDQQILTDSLQPPSAQHLLGTDEMGRDIASRIMHGARLSLLVGVSAVLVGLAVALPLGLMSGYYGGFTDMLVQRIVDALFAFPGFLLALFLAAILGVGLSNVIVAVGVSIMPMIARLARSGAMAVANEDYIDNARSIGCSQLRIMARHVLPNMIGPIIVQSTVYIGVAIIAAAGLGFLGLGVQAPASEWGAMLGSGRTYLLSSPHLTIIPGIFIFLTVLAFNYMGDGLRDALDPKSK